MSVEVNSPGRAARNFSRDFCQEENGNGGGFRDCAATLIRRDERPAFVGEKAILLELSHGTAAC
jgi:hypothetical protein